MDPSHITSPGSKALKKSPLFRTMSERALVWLLADAEIITLVDGEVLLDKENISTDSYYVLLEGVLTVERLDRPSPGIDNIRDTTNTFLARGREKIHLHARAVLGEFNALLGKPFEASMHANSDVLLLRLPGEPLREVLTHRGALRRKAIASLEIASQRQYITGGSIASAHALLSGIHPAELLAFVPKHTSDRAIKALTDLTAKAIAGDFGDRVARVFIGSEAEHHSSAQSVDQVRVPAEGFAQWWDKARYSHDYVLAFGDLAPLEGLHHTKVMVQEASKLSRTESFGHRGPDLFTLLVLPPHATTLPPKVEAKVLWRSLMGDRNPLTLSQLQHPVLEGHSCRIKLDLEATAKGWTPSSSVASRDPQTRAAIGRFSRALTHRRVGVALGGSGAWGYAHVALLKMLMAGSDPVPVDVVSGVSSGSLIGAYFCAYGAQGLDRLVERGSSGSFDLMVASSVLTSRFIEVMVSADLSGQRLEGLQVDFFPLCTDLTSGESVTWARGPVGLAVRSASSAPGLFTPTYVDDHCFVDGCFVNNVPVSVVAKHADMLVASNAYPYDTKSGHFALFGGGLGRFLRGLDPVNRVRVLTTSANLMLHTSGEWQARGAGLTWDASQRTMPLIGSMEFGKAKERVEQIMDDENAQRFVSKVRRHWDKLRRPSALS